MPQTTTSQTHWQYVSDNAFADGNWVTFTDKLLGLEICTDGPGRQPTCVPIPVGEVPGLLRAIMRWVASGNLAISRGEG